MTLADYTDRNLIEPVLHATDLPGTLQELSNLLRQEDRVPEATTFYQAASKRELICSTALENGIAFPHARLPNLTAVSFALGRAPEAIPWGSSNKPKVRLVFLLAVPANDAATYLSVLYGMAKLSKESELLKRLVEAKDQVAMLDILRTVTLRGQAPALA